MKYNDQQLDCRYYNDDLDRHYRYLRDALADARDDDLIINTLTNAQRNVQRTTVGTLIWRGATRA